jgi:hypothetical protein
VAWGGVVGSGNVVVGGWMEDSLAGFLFSF